MVPRVLWIVGACIHTNALCACLESGVMFPHAVGVRAKHKRHIMSASSTNVCACMENHTDVVQVCACVNTSINVPMQANSCSYCTFAGPCQGLPPQVPLRKAKSPQRPSLLHQVCVSTTLLLQFCNCNSSVRMWYFQPVQVTILYDLLNL